jgi:hypothetical protein
MFLRTAIIESISMTSKVSEIREEIQGANAVCIVAANIFSKVACFDLFIPSFSSAFQRFIKV